MKLTPEASMRMRASPGAGVGVGRSRRVRTSAEPVVRICMACMVVRVQQAAECLNQQAQPEDTRRRSRLYSNAQLAWRPRDVDVTLDCKVLSERSLKTG